MTTSRLGGALAVALLLALSGGQVLAALVEPNVPNWPRGLRPDYVKTWYIYNDSKLDGILNPGDTFMATFKNWWTPVSSGTQHNYSAGPYGGGANPLIYEPNDHKSSAPMSFASYPDGLTDPYWMPNRPGAMQFYMTYSDIDNQEPNFWSGLPTQDLRTMEIEAHRYRNGYAFGWLTGAMKVDPNTGAYVNDQTPAGTLAMSVYVHNGRTAPGGEVIPGWGTSKSNPQVSLSNNIDYRARYDPDGAGPVPENIGPPIFNDALGIYDPNLPVNIAYNNLRSLNNTDFAAIVSSMDVREYDPNNLPTRSWMLRTPKEIADANGPKDQNGNTYLYQDTFLNEGYYVRGATAGGVVAGLAGLQNYDPNIQNWGEQQVIRIDIPPWVLQSGEGNGNISELVFYDFGSSIPGASGTQQTNPTTIVFNVDPNGNIYYVPNPNNPNDRIYFPENRIYIAEVTLPEPGTLCLLIGGGFAVLFRRRKLQETTTTP
jgi:hypothetical protein